MASLPPYTYSMLTGYANRLAGESTVKVSRIGRSLAGLDIPLIAICSSNIQSCREYFGDKRDRKRAIVVMARTHPSETCSNYTLEAFV